ncbi:MAG TPA: hypothetical protein VLB44_03885 [Kofleriaceae bacterium]|nr:hypothetical protein [Kofleriaceae bacterium]
MYRYGDGTPFPLEENFIETLTSAVEACTNAFMPLQELDSRRERARASRAEADRELAKLAELEKTLTSALAPYMVADKQNAQAQGVAQKTLQSAKAAIQQARALVDGRVQAMEAQAGAGTASDAVLHALRPFFDHYQLPNAKWIMSWDVRGAEPHADAVASSGRLTASFTLQLDNLRTPIRVGDLADGVIVHMMKKGLLGKAKPAPVDLARYVMVAYEKTGSEHVITLKEKADRASQGLRFMVSDTGATWQSMSLGGDAETDPNPLDFEDVDGIRRLGEGAHKALRDLMSHRVLTDLSLGNQALSSLPEPRIVPMEVLQQLTPLSRTIRERSRVSGELVLKRDIGGGRREELFVPRAQLAQQFMKLPMEYRKPFEDMGVSSEDTQPAVSIGSHQLRPPAKVPPSPPGAPTIKVEKD